jgi:hypothetical protein
MNTAAAIAEMLRVWNKIEAAAKAQFPFASAEEIYQITAAAMQAQLERPHG